MKTYEYFHIHDDRIEVDLDGIALLRLTLTNKGTAYTLEERRALRLEGLLPPAVSTLDQQVERIRIGFWKQPTPILKYQFLRQLQDRMEVLFYAFLARYLNDTLPIVYTPTVGEAVQKFSAMYQTSRGLSVSIENVDRTPELLTNYPFRDVRMIVATDSSAILGIGDQGYGGLAIPIGKLALYTVGAGVAPYYTMPTALDVGTDRAHLLDDPGYLGVRARRLRGEAYFHFMDQFVDAVHARWPGAILQWEDLAKDAAFDVLARYRKRHPSFNDDIQGTGAVALAGLRSACRLRGRSLADETIVVYGAGAGGGGVAAAIRDGLARDGVARPEDRIFVLDSKGLLVEGRAMEAYKRPFAKPGPAMGLLETIRASRTTVLLGLSGQPGTFTQEIAAAMAANAERPIIFPLSNPTSACEATPADLLAWTGGRALVAAGSPFPDTAQGNNAFIFPGLGQGSILARAREVTDGMVAEAAEALAAYTAERHPGRIYPPVEDLGEVSIHVTTAVIRRAVADGVAAADLPADLPAYVRDRFWQPRYLPVVKSR
ncbi:MAG TPA: oxaloacetate-decarboxylating malate dehydrogenase [Haliangiales bacterium]|nr:oxaloacetate-decarboxylating malate dehydrogenase [Haliangiales bacterium]